MPYIYHTDEERKAMLDALGFDSEDALFEQIPAEFRLSEALAIGEGLPEWETLRYFQGLGAKNTAAGSTVSFLGGGIYDHIVPSVVNHMTMRSEFYTAYTPYQAEVSQGTLQVIFEYQTMISRLVGLPVANASMYDGATALAEAALMAAKVTKRNEVIYAENLHPRFVNVLRTYADGQDIVLHGAKVTEAGDVDGAHVKSLLNDRVAAVIVQSPNYFGVVEQPWSYIDALRDAGTLLVVAADPISLSILRAPGSYGADIVVGEGQTLGNNMSFGGPLLGFMACAQSHIRSLPGRLVSETKDLDGQRAYTLTLQTREQHIRREKATSNICTNQGLLALRSTVYLSAVGEQGFKELGGICHAKAHKLAGMIEACNGFSLRHNGPFFREFAVRCPVPASDVVAAAREVGILAGIPLDKYYGDEARNDLLVAVTEKRTDEDMTRLCDVLKGVG